MEEAYFGESIAEYYDQVIFRYHPQEEYLEELLKIIPKKSSIIELGCGTGAMTIPLFNNSMDIEGVDSSVYMLRRLKEKNREIKTFLSDVRCFSSDKEYDYSICCSGPFSVKGDEIESYIFDESLLGDTIIRFSKMAKNGLLINKGHGKDSIEIRLKDGELFRHREIREKDYTIMVHLIYNNRELFTQITHVKKVFPIDKLLDGAEIKDFDKFKLIKYS